jgi:AcrR family transcriptional regulator
MNKNVERGEATRSHLVEVATRLFSANGYEGTSIETVLAESGVSRGSLYHHFKGKDALFWAVLEGVGARVGEQIMAELKGVTDPIAALRIDCLAWIRLARDPVVQQTVLIDAPAVLGWERWRDLNEQTNLGIYRSELAYAADQGRIDPEHVDVFAHIVLVAVNEIAMMIARSPDPDAALAAGESALSEFLDRLLGGGQTSGGQA